MLTFEEKLAIIESFPELERKDVSLGRVNFHYEQSGYDKKIVVYHLHPNGNGYVYAGHLVGYKLDSKGMVNIREFSEKALRSVIEKSILILTPKPQADVPVEEHADEMWVSSEGFKLILTKEEEMWNVYAGELLDGTFNSYEEAAEYLDEEGFEKQS